MKILFVNPACQDPRVTDQDALVVPLGLYYLSALMMEEGMDTHLVNLAPEGPRAAQVFEQILLQENPDIIGFSVTNPGRINALACAQIAKKHRPGATIVFGGPAPTFMGEHLFKTCPDLDIVVKGEGETAFKELVIELQKAKKARRSPRLEIIKGLLFRQAQGLKDTGKSVPLKDLDTLPHPSKYFAYQHLGMSRGCPGKCTFCGSPRFWGHAGVRFHSVDWFFQEIATLVQRGVSHFFISDDTFTMDKNRIIDLCKRIVDARLKITWNAISRVDHVDDTLFYWMRRAGCIQISFGIESGAPAIKKILGKPILNEIAIEAFKQATSFGIMPRAYFIYGSPKETQTTIQESIDLLLKLKPLSAIFYLLVLFPGTHLYQRALAQGKINEDIWLEPIEDLPYFEIDETLDFTMVKGFGDQLRQAFYENLPRFVQAIELKETPELFPLHADFLSRLALTFSHGDYAQKIPQSQAIAKELFQRALGYAPDARAFLGLGMIWGQKREMDQAQTVLKQGLHHFPNHRDLLICLGVNQMNQGDFSQALETFTPLGETADVRRYIDICKLKVKNR